MRTPHETESDPMFDDSHSTYPSVLNRQELQAVIELERLDLYNQLQPCGASALRRRLGSLGVENVPSARTIGRILTRRQLSIARSRYGQEN
jgi:hypothetical protein